MKERFSKKTVIRIMGAYVSWVMGSGFATGQEIFQFFTSYGYKSFALIAIDLAGFVVVGGMLLTAGFRHKDEDGFSPARFFCGRYLGAFYEWFIPVSMFGGMVVLISGAGATLNEYYGLNHYIGALLVAVAAFAAYVAGFQRFVRIVSVIGPVIICFTLIVGIVTVIKDFDAASAAGEAASELSRHQPVGIWWLAGILYLSYNLADGSVFYTALGGEAGNVREALQGAIFGSTALILAILLMNTAMLTEAARICGLSIPSLYLAEKISAVLGLVFSVILICGIFSTCSAMLWTVGQKFTRQGSRRSYIFAGCIAALAFALGLLPFTDLIGTVYPYLGYAGLGYIICVIYKGIKQIYMRRTEITERKED